MSPAPAGDRVWSRYVAVGDSFTEGLNDAPEGQEEGPYVGWADRLAALLAGVAHARGADFGYANLAIRGRLLADITERQVPLALELRPDLVSIVGGGNDILRPRADMTALAASLEASVVAVRATGADVLLATPTDPVGAPVLRHLRGRHAIHTANIWTIARRHGCAVIDQWGLRAIKDWRMWSHDRIHMSPAGHERVASAAFAALGFTPADAGWEVPLPPAEPLDRVAWARANGEWARDHVAPWVRRRLAGTSSGDSRSAKRPEVTPLA